MKGNKHLFVFSLFIYFLLSKNVYAACDYETQVNLQREAAGVALSYEESGTYLNIIIDNLPSSLYLVAENNSSNTMRIYGSGVKQNYLWTNTDEPYNLQVDIYASNSTSCPGTLISTTYLKLPMYNKYSTREECNNSSLYVCNTFTDSYVDETSFQNAFNKVSKIEVDEDEDIVVKEEKENGFLEFLKNNKLYIISFGSLIIFGIVIGVILYKRKNRIF